jgi:DNA/RNA endonuclease YhcR with UshA esterase domain
MIKTHPRLTPFVLVTLSCLTAILQSQTRAEQQPSKAASSVSAELTTKPPIATPTEPAPSTPPAVSKVLSNVPTSEAKAHIGETATVCGLVTGGKFLESSKGKPTFLNFERPFPDHTFTVVIFESDRAKFKDPPESWFDGKTVCVSGAIIDYKGKPEIVVHDPSQIVIQE